VDAGQLGHAVLAGAYIGIGLVDRGEQSHRIAIHAGRRRCGSEHNGKKREDDDTHYTNTLIGLMAAFFLAGMICALISDC
jgi:hypothetical protein